MKPTSAAACSRSGCHRQVEVNDGGYRVIVGYRRPHAARIVFLYAFAKGDKANISAKEEAVLDLVAEAFIATTDRQIEEALGGGLDMGGTAS